MSHKSKGISTPVEFDAERCRDVKKLNASWHYNWSPNPQACAGDNVPMVWSQHSLAALERGTMTLGGNSIYVLGFNEPDLEGQANMRPGACARYWNRLEILYPNKLLISPAPSGKDYKYLGRMRNQYVKQFGVPPKFDVLACHSYLSTTNMREVLDWMDSKADAWGIREIWLTEWGLPPPLGNIYQASIDYLHQCRDIFNEYERLTRFALFTSRHPYYNAMCCYEWSTNGDMTPIGKAYKEL